MKQIYSPYEINELLETIMFQNLAKYVPRGNDEKLKTCIGI